MKHATDITAIFYYNCVKSQFLAAAESDLFFAVYPSTLHGARCADELNKNNESVYRNHVHLREDLLILLYKKLAPSGLQVLRVN